MIVATMLFGAEQWLLTVKNREQWLATTVVDRLQHNIVNVVENNVQQIVDQAVNFCKYSVTSLYSFSNLIQSCVICHMEHVTCRCRNCQEFTISDFICDAQSEDCHPGPFQLPCRDAWGDPSVRSSIC